MLVVRGARRVGGTPQGPKGLLQCILKLPCSATAIRSSSRHFLLRPRRFHLVLAPSIPRTTPPRRLFSRSARGNERAMSAEYNALGKDYRARLKSAPDDAQMARLVLEDIREGDGPKEGEADECRELLEYGQERGLRPVFRVWDAMRQDECKTEPSFCIAALVAEAKLEQSDQITTRVSTKQSLVAFGTFWTTRRHILQMVLPFTIKFLVLLRDSGSYDQVLSVYENLRDSRCLQDDPLYDIVVKAMIKWKKRDLRNRGTAAPTNQQQLILEILDYIHKHHAAVDFSPVYISAIRAAFKVNEFEFVLTILRKTRSSGLDASGEYTHVFMSFKKAKQYEYLLRVFEECDNVATSTICNAAVVAAVHLEKRGVVLEICGEMISRDITSREVYSFPLKTARWGQEHDLVELLLPKVDKKTATDVILGRHF
ncbi:hypothetical protein GQ600_3381 [Phytophthora cactorum]|nr:hypothetical protein GQ600_3381 [Phytophthora cactorum]